MSFSTWVRDTVVIPVTKEIIAAVKEDNDRVIKSVGAQVDSVITTVIDSLTKSIDTASGEVTKDVNSVVDNLFEEFKKTFLPWLK